jgi:hypothetical protein
MITVSDIQAGDLVQLVDQRGNTAAGTVLLDATRDGSASARSASWCRSLRKRQPVPGG